MYTGSNLLPLWLGLIILLFIVILGLILVGTYRARKARETHQVDTSSPNARINLKDKKIAERLGVPSASETGVDPRGEDIGGNFWEVPKKDAPKEES
ncbi:hypothetical protein [Ktedonospora formicarum]|uniref:Uncharacterized protein n=1 Tax=Ktedonospora formicarum TaxID=2778364 RepID=A0A8J3MRH0_9CHLR|nr:hypothetical protein [Ktedonospora formicarum]GHO43618.1 hypothetical protein KSX_17810 [Ktedonospora formicarum]